MSHSQSDVQQQRARLPEAWKYARHAGQAIFVLAALLIVVLTVLRADVFWHNEAYLDDASGNWTALARDLTRGVFYRPLQSAAGFGGSRYFPLHFTLHAGVMTLLTDPIRSGFAVSGFSITLLVAGTYVMLRRLGASRVLAATSATFVLVAHPAQEALLAIKGDGLAAALNVWGMAMCLGPATGGAGVLAAAALFALAFATKVTTVSGLGAALLWLWFGGRRADAVRLLVATVCGMGIVLGVMYVGSHGVVFDVMRASATGGAGIKDLLSAPLTLARQARRVPETLAFVQLGCAALLLVLLRPRPWLNPAAWFFLGVLGVTTIIFGSPGTDTNHLIDLHVASIVLVASLIATVGEPFAEFGGAALVVAALAASLSLASGLANAASESRRGRVAEALAMIPDTSRPILAQNPLVPVEAGQRAYVLDPFMIRLNLERDPAFGDTLWAGIREQQFGAVVFERDPGAESTREMYKVILGERFVEEVERNYVAVGHVGLRTVYLPRPR